MKNLITILLISLSLISCGSQLPPPNSNSDIKNIIGNTVNIEDIEVTKYDFPEEMNWYDAKKACEALGEGWRLPTQDELNILFQNRDKIGGWAFTPGFGYRFYWSSMEYMGEECYGRPGNECAFKKYFRSGTGIFTYKKDKNQVRAVRSN
jgi:hypothetical protein